VIRFQVIKGGKVHKVLNILKLCDQKPTYITSQKESVLESVRKKRGFGNTLPLPPFLSSSHSSSLSSEVSPTLEEPEEREQEEPEFEFSQVFQVLGDGWSNVLLHEEKTQLCFSGCVWADEDNLLSASLYPEVLQLDTTCNTNKRGYPFVFCVGVNAENKTQNWVTGLLPNEQRLSFMWLLSLVLPAFLGSQTLKAITTVVADGNQEQIDAIEYVIQSRIFSSDCKRLLCYWHTISKLLKEELSFMGSDAIEVIRVTLRRIANLSDHIEVQYEWNYLVTYVEERFSSKLHMSEKAKEVFETLKSKQPHWCRAWFPNTRNFGEITSSRVETENLQHKRNVRVHSRASLTSAAKVDYARATRRTTEEILQAQCTFLKNPIHEDDDSSESDSESSLPQWIFKTLTRYGTTLFEEQWKLSLRYDVTPRDSHILNVQLKDSFLEEDSPSAKRHLISLRNKILSCSCVFTKSFAMICRHVMAAMKHLEICVTSLHVHIRWHMTWMNGLFLDVYHHQFNDGYSGAMIDLEKIPHEEVVSNSIEASSPSSPSTLSKPLRGPASPPQEVIKTPYLQLKRQLVSMTRVILEQCSHSNAAMEYAMNELREFEDNFYEQYQQKFLSQTSQVIESRPTTDQTVKRKRALFSFERRMRRATPNGTVVDISEERTQTRSQSSQRQDTPPLLEEH
jgi:hypothetical protein